MDAFLKRGNKKKAPEPAKNQSSKKVIPDMFNLSIKNNAPQKKSKVDSGVSGSKSTKDVLQSNTDDVEMEAEDDPHAKIKQFQPWVEK